MTFNISIVFICNFSLILSKTSVKSGIDGVLLETLKFERLLPPLCFCFFLFISIFLCWELGIIVLPLVSSKKKAHTATYVCPQPDIHTQAPIYAPSLCTATLTGHRCSHLMAMSTLTCSVRANPISDMHGDIFLTFSAADYPYLLLVFPSVLMSLSWILIYNAEPLCCQHPR